MADKQRVAHEEAQSDFGFGSDISDAASAWGSVLDDEEGVVEGDVSNDAGGDEPTDDVDQDDPESEVESEEDETEDDAEEESDEDDDSDEDEAEDQPAELDPNAKVKVKVDGEEVEVTYEELKAGYSRTQDYTRKTQEVAEARRAAEQEKQKVLEQQQQWSNALAQLDQHLQASTSSRTEAEWQKLRQEDELTYFEERDKERTVNERLQAIKQEQQRVQQEVQEYQQQQLKQAAQAEFEKLLEVVPDWKDDEARTKDFGQINAYGQQIGYTPEELGAVIDHRAIRVLRDAAKYQQLMNAKKASAEKKTPSKVRQKPLKPGTPSGKTPAKGKRDKASKRLAKAQNVDAAAGYFETLLDD